MAKTGRFLLEDRSTIPEDGQADPTFAHADDLDRALVRARSAAKDLNRMHGRGQGIVYVYEVGTNNVWSVQYRPEPGVPTEEAVTGDDGRPQLDDDGEPLVRRRYVYPVAWRIVHDPTEQVHEWDATDEAGRAIISDKRWSGAIEVTDYDEDGNVIEVNDQRTGATRDVAHVEVNRAQPR